MTDRVQLLLDIGVLQAEAALRGDDRAVATLRSIAAVMMELQAEAAALEKRRRNERERQRTSRESRDKRDSPTPLSHSPPTQKTDTQHNTAREPDLEEVTHRRCAMLAEAVGPELWPDIDAFLKRRDYWTWKSWADEMVKLVGPGSQFTPVDLAQVCRDDGALARPIGSPFGLRRFIGNAQRERSDPPDMKPRRRVGGVGQRSHDNAMEAIKDL